MINHILVPLDGSVLAECVLPHILTIAPAMKARVTLLHVLELPRNKGGEQAIDPLDWHLKKRKVESYLNHIAARLHESALEATTLIQEGIPAECIIEFANNNNVDLIALSTHGHSGLSRWSVSSVVQKIILRSFKSTLLVRAYLSLGTQPIEFHYRRLFVGLDYSARAEYVLPIAMGLAKFYDSQLVLGTIIRKPEMFHRFPLSEEDAKLIDGITERNYREASHYYEQLNSQLTSQGVDLDTRIVVSDNVTASLHDMVEQVNADLVMLVAHGHSGEGRWPYGSIATSFIAYGATSLMIFQDLTQDEIKFTQAEMAAREIKGH